MNHEADPQFDDILPEILLSDLFSRWPATLPIFLQYRMSCVGCDMTAFDTLQEAITNYGLNQAEFIAELRAAAAGARRDR